MLKKKEYHYGREPGKHEAKMAQYQRFLEKREKNVNPKKKSLTFIIDATKPSATPSAGTLRNVPITK